MNTPFAAGCYSQLPALPVGLSYATPSTTDASYTSGKCAWNDASGSLSASPGASCVPPCPASFSAKTATCNAAGASWKDSPICTGREEGV